MEACHDVAASFARSHLQSESLPVRRRERDRDPAYERHDHSDWTRCQCISAAAGADGSTGMAPFPSGVRAWLATEATDMHRGMNGRALQVQEALGRDPHGGDLYVFPGSGGNYRQK